MPTKESLEYHPHRMKVWNLQLIAGIIGHTAHH